MTAARLNWFAYAAPYRFYGPAGSAVRWFALLAALAGAAGLALGFGFAPTDRQQGDVYRIIFLHVPTAWMRSEEHTSELQSLMRISYAVFCLKKKKKKHNT